MRNPGQNGFHFSNLVVVGNPLPRLNTFAKSQRAFRVMRDRREFIDVSWPAPWRAPQLEHGLCDRSFPRGVSGIREHLAWIQPWRPSRTAPALLRNAIAADEFLPSGQKHRMPRSNPPRTLPPYPTRPDPTRPLPTPD